MDIEAIRQYFDEHPNGIRVHMVDGRVYDLPHRDFVAFGPIRATASSRRGVHGTSFIAYLGDPPVMKLINALLVSEVTPLTPNGRNGHTKRRKRA